MSQSPATPKSAASMMLGNWSFSIATSLCNCKSIACKREADRADQRGRPESPKLARHANLRQSQCQRGTCDKAYKRHGQQKKDRRSVRLSLDPEPSHAGNIGRDDKIDPDSLH